MTLSSRIPTCKRAAVVLLMFFASVQFIRSYFIINTPYLNEAQYEAGTERMPYQGRILMADLARVADRNHVVVSVASHLRGPIHDPSTFVIAVVGLLSILVTALVIHRWYRLLLPGGILPWLPFGLFLWMLYATYLARFQEAIYFPYDLLSLATFTLALFLCYTERYIFLALLFVAACFNRETVILMTVPLAVNAWLRLRECPRRIPVREIALFCVFVAVWLSVRAHYAHLFAHNPTELHDRLRENLRFLASPQTWSQILSGAGFLLPVPFLWFRSMPDLRMRLYSSVILVWCAAMFYYGLLPESRIFGELIGFLAVYCTVQFETFIRNSPRLARSSSDPVQP